MNISRLLTALNLLPTLLLAQAQPWSTSRVQGKPEPPHAFVTEQVLASVSLQNVTDMVPGPGLAQWLIAENGGKIWCVSQESPEPKADLAIDIKALHPACDHVYGLAFHPKFATNQQVFITYTVGAKLEEGSRLSRFRVTQSKPLVIDPQSEEILLTWLSGGHNGAAIAFGPDDMLYVSTGDAEVPNPPDPLSTGQDITDLLGSILRIDVDQTSGGKAYAIPQDNPFLKTPGARPEVWAYGFRNPWKISFDRTTGRLWCGDVGWQEWESIFLVTRGGNYGWAATEGSNVLDMKRYVGPSPISPPVVTHNHSEAASITGGFVYHGMDWPELKGAYIYADYETGKVWALWHDGSQITRHEEIADTPHAISTFAQDEAGELYLVHYANPSTIHRLARNPEAGKPARFPRLLSETGLFADTAAQTPSPGMQPFSIRAPMWADGATAQRFVGMTGTIDTKVTLNKTTGRPSAKITWPKDAVLAKTVSIELTQGDTASARNIETQMLHFDGEDWNAYSYRWNEAGTDAELVGAAGDARSLDLTGSRFPGNKHRYTYRFHSRSECLRCHTAWSGFTLSFNAQQLSEPDKLIAAGCFDTEFLKASNARLVDPHDETASLESRARSWLHTNCAGCHREHGGGSVPLMVNAELDTDEFRAINEPLTRGDFGMADARVIVPGQPGSSVLLHRIAKTGAGHMPMIGAREVDVAGLQLLAQWIRTLSPGQPQPDDPTDARGALNLLLKMDRDGADQALARSLAKESPNAHIRELFERFLPDTERTKTLGPSATADQITRLSGDAKRGAALFTPTGKAATCTACHFLNGVGRDFGPDLSKVGARLTAEQIIESLLTPSKTLAQGYQPLVLTLKDGTIQTGFLVKREADHFHLKIATGQTLPLQLETIQTEQVLPVSLMPEGLLQNFTPQEAADLVAYLSSLR
jgi:putative heme-binding domain-containing protein